VMSRGAIFMCVCTPPRCSTLLQTTTYQGNLVDVSRRNIWVRVHRVEEMAACFTHQSQHAA